MVTNNTEYYIGIVEGSPNMLIAIDTSYVITVINKNYTDIAEKMYGMKPTVGTKFGEIFKIKGENTILKSMADGFTVAFNGGKKTDEYNFSQGVLSNITFEASFFPIKNSDLKIIGAACVIKDISESKRLDERLKKTLEEESLVFDAVPAWIFFKDTENKYIRVNQSYAEALELKKEDINGKSLFDIFPKKIADEYWKIDKEVIESGKPKNNVIESRITRNGTIWAQTNRIPYRDVNGKIIGVIGVVTDITDQKKAEDQVEEKIVELEKFNKLFIGREIKMIELKEEIDRLSKKCG